MNTSVGTKARKKQLGSVPAAIPAPDRDFELSLLSLETACQRIFEIRFAQDKMDTERLYWQQRFKNIATPVSLALNEYKGPRRFHYHYRHREDDESILTPVLEPSPADMLAQVCEDAMRQSRALAGIHDAGILRAQHLLENALQTFLLRYKRYKASIK